MMIGTNKIQDSIIKAIEYLVNRKIETAGFDKTVTGTVIEILGDNYYKVIINDVTRNIYSSTEMSFKIGNVVFVTCPQGDFNNAFISGINRK